MTLSWPSTGAQRAGRASGRRRGKGRRHQEVAPSPYHQTSSRWLAWSFHKSLQNKLDIAFTTPSSGLSVKLTADGDPGPTDEAAGPWRITCKHRGRTGPGLTRLVYQVNGKGGVPTAATSSASIRRRSERGSTSCREVDEEVPWQGAASAGG